MFETLLFFFKQKYILFLETDYFFLPRQILKNRYASAKTSNTALVELIESAKMIMRLIVRCFSVHVFYKNTLYKNI